MAINNQDKTEIHNLPEVTTLQPGMMVAVDSEPTGTKSFNLTAALENTVTEADITAINTSLSNLEADLTDMKTESLADPEIMYVYGQDSNGNIANKPLIVATDFIDQSMPAQTPSLTFNRYKETSSAPGADQSFNELTITKTDSNDNQVFIRTILPPKPSFIDVGNSTFLKYWNESDGGHIDWKPVNEVPTSTSSNAGQVLTVNNSGTPSWQALQPGDTNLLVDVARPLDSTKAITATKTYTEIKQAVDSGKHVILRVQEGATPGYLDAWTEYYTIQSYADDSGTIRFLEDAIFPSVSSSDNRYNTVETRNNFRMLAIFSDNTWKSYSINPSSGIRIDAPKTVSTNTVDVQNNMITPISTSQSTLTVNCIYDNEDAPNFVVEITPTNNLTLTVTATDRWRTQTTTLKSAVAAGNALTAGKTYQVTAVGTCWTLAEFGA